MSEFFKFLLGKGGKALPPDPIPAQEGLGRKVPPAVDVPQETAGVATNGSDGKADALSESSHLTLRLADFLARIPPHLRKEGEFDPEKPLSFEMGWMMGRIKRGLSTVPLAKLLDAAPDLFTDDAATERDLEIRFPWRRVAQLLRESELAEKQNGGETLAQKFRRQFQPGKAPDPEFIENPVALEAGPPEPHPVKGREGRTGENVWYTRSKTGVGEVIKTLPPDVGSKTAPAPSSVMAKDGRGAADSPLRVPDSAPALMELPSTEQKGDSRGEQFTAPPEKAANYGAPPATDLLPKPDLMDLLIESGVPGKIDEPAPTNLPNLSAGLPEIPDSAPALMELEMPAQLPNTEANSQKVDLRHGKSRNELRIADLELRLSALSEQHRSELSVLRSECERMVAQARADATKFGREGAANFHAERKRIAAEKDEQLARIQTDLRAVIEVKQNEITELRAARKEALAERRKKEEAMARFIESREALERENQAFREEFQKALTLKQQHESAAAALRAEHQSALQALETSRRDNAKALDEIKAESEREITTLRAAADYKAVEMEARFKHERALLLEEKDRALATMEAEHRAALAARHAGYSAAREGHEKERTDLAGDREAAEQRWAAEREMLIKEKTALATEYEQRLSALIAEHERAATAFDAEAVRSLTAAEAAKHEGKMARQAAEHQRVIDELHKEAERKTSELQTAFEDERQRIRAEHEGATAMVAAVHAAALADKEAEIDRVKSELQKVVVESPSVWEKALLEIGAVREGHIREKEALMAEHTKRLGDLAMQHEEAMSALRNDAEKKAAIAEAARVAREAEIARLQEEHRSALADQAAAHEAAAAQARVERHGLAREKETLVAEHAQRLDSITKEAVQALRSQAEQKAAEAEAVRASREAEVARLKEEHEQTLAEQAAAHEKAAAQALLDRDGLAREKDAIVAAHAQRLTLLEMEKAGLHAELDAAKSEQDRLTQLLRLQEQSASELASKHELDLLASGLESAQIVAEQKEKAEKELADLEKQHQQALAESVKSRERALADAATERESLIRKMEADLAERDRRLAAQTKEHQEKLAGKAAEITLWKSEYAGAVDASAAACQKLAAERDQLDREKEAVIREREERLAKLTKKHETALAAFAGLRADFESKHSEGDATIASQNAEIAALRAELEATRTSLTMQRDDALSESAARANELEIRNRGEEQFAAEVAQYRERIKTVLAERTALAEKLEKERRVHAHAIQGGREAMERLRVEHARAAAEDAEKHRKALSAAREEAHKALAAARAELERDRQEVIAARSSILREITARAAAAVPPPEDGPNR